MAKKNATLPMNSQPNCLTENMLSALLPELVDSSIEEEIAWAS
jgi:hypothetical protein